MTLEIFIHIVAIAASFLLAALTFIFGALWGHHAAIEKRVTYSQCHENREDCRCLQENKRLEEELKELKREMDENHPREK